MVINLKKDSFVIFDLDDTLYPEIEFLKSGYKFIAESILPFTRENIYTEMLRRYELGQNVFDWIVSVYSKLNNNLTLSYLLQLYRQHKPTIQLNKGAGKLLDTLRGKSIAIGLITDGRSITQRNKLKALELDDYFSDIIISEEFGSEKPDERNYLYFKEKYPDKYFYFIGDNTSKDFIVPLKLGWTSICLRNNGGNIHPQDRDSLKSVVVLESLEDLRVSLIL